ncbi:hypothetical protein APHAL10511_003687 [Amanita phalloides]|nr:hypothetical protein APHAL10511_003687 [Amanita phalloides]
MDLFNDIPIVSVPQRLWKTANGARVLAILVALPIVILALLDIASYGIARTLGVIDDVKASTSDVASVHVSHRIHENGTNNNSSPGTSREGSDSDGTASPLRSDEDLYSVVPEMTVADVSTAESSASEEHLFDHTLHNLGTSDSSQSLISIPPTSARAGSNAWEPASNSDGILHQRQVQRAEYDP